MEKRKIRVLIADDEPHIRDLLKLIVTALGAEVVGAAEDGESAVTLFQQLSPDMLLLDINMPKLDGIKVLKQVMMMNERALVIMLTAQNTMEVVKECLDAGARNFILKNNKAEDLSKLLAETWGEYVSEIRMGR